MGAIKYRLICLARLKRSLLLCALIAGFLSSLAAFGQAIPEGSSTLQFNAQSLHIYKRGHGDTAVLMLSGPTDTWYSDSAWFVRLQGTLEADFSTYALDMPGFAGTSSEKGPDYFDFSRDVSAVLERIPENKVILVSFASSNLTVFHLLQNTPTPEKLRGVILIDPDVLTPYSISRYRSDAEPFFTRKQDYADYVQSGQYTARAKEKNAQDWATLKRLATQPTSADESIDWTQIEAVFAFRESIQGQLATFKMVANYYQNLAQALDLFEGLSIDERLPLSIVNTDFESAYLQQAEASEHPGLVRWREEGDTWMQSLCLNRKRCRYLSLADQQHLVPFSQPDMIRAELLRMEN
jgi:pimeloyl-ACP methyl ester carboxylesterase